MNKQGQDWPFIEELKRQRSRNAHWYRTELESGEVDLRKGVGIIKEFPDPGTLLESAYGDLESFFMENGISPGNYRIITKTGRTDIFEAYRIEISMTECVISAADTEGIRRGIYYLEDLLSSSGGPFLKPGKVERRPWLKTRISRCFFGPIKRPPLNRDELLDDVDYYPAEYLNRLAYEGINALWLTISWRDLCHTSFRTPSPDAEKRIAKLRRTVGKCTLYGIKIYVFCIEPEAVKKDDDLLVKHPSMGGLEEKEYAFKTVLCPFSPETRQYAYESVKDIFSRVPGLGGLINITLGERLTTCADAHNQKCAGCERSAGDVIRASLEPMKEALDAVSPALELISWLYVPLNGSASWTLDDKVIDVTEKSPDGIITQYNFESGGGKEQLGKYRHAGDYWLSYTGPSDLFQNVATTSLYRNNPVSAKIQVGCSHETATAPFIPVPGLLYRKYKAMKELGVSHVMQCWYFGNYPGIMNKAAGELAFEEFGDSEEDFLLRLAKTCWGRNSTEIVRVWKLFSNAYGNYPLSNMFQYYGPMHDGVVWPLHLKPVNEPLAPTWRLDYGTSGDRYGECLGAFSIEEALSLVSELSGGWRKGFDIMENLGAAPDNMTDIRIAEALNIMFESGKNILRFYYLRDILLDTNSAFWNSTLDEMKNIVFVEIKNSARMIELCESDSCLGFHSEAEGYKFSPEKLKWRIEQLNCLIENDFPELENRIKEGMSPFSEDARKVYTCSSGNLEDAGSFSWRADYEKGKLKIAVYSPDPFAEFRIFLEHRNFYPPEILFPIEGIVETEVPGDRESFAFNIVRESIENGERIHEGWVEYHPLKYRLALRDYNPACMGKLFIDKERKS